jgi:aflatoxin B1 aldehyde reductase
LAEANKWKKPDVYQSSYNAFHRSAEPELIPCLRKYNIAYYVFSPLAGGMLTGKYDRATDAEAGGRFDANAKGGYYRKQYWNEPSFAALDILEPVLKKEGLSTSEAALRWLSHHSGLQKEKGDAVIIGASRAEQLVPNLEALEKGPLSEEVVKAFEEAWVVLKSSAVPYFA